MEKGMKERRPWGCFIPMEREKRKRRGMIIRWIRNGKEIS
jgi:hypothetical protein